MGVPGFFAWLLRKNKELMKKSITKKINILYFDANSLFHPQSFIVLDYIQKSIALKKLEHKMHKRIINYIKYVISIVKPNEVYICVDGVAPLAKIVNQRRRRFKAVIEKQQKQQIKNKHHIITYNEWSNSAISPGTSYMIELDRMIRKFVKKSTISCKYSSYNEIGEGEHKIINDIRNQPDDMTYAIYGMDADLIFLSLVCNKEIYLIREDVNNIKTELINLTDINQPLFYVDITEVRNEIKRNMPVQKIKFNRVMDFVALCFLMGNDFVPSLPTTGIKIRGLDTLLTAYTYVINNTIYKKQLVINGKLNLYLLRDILKFLTVNEDELLYYFISYKPRQNCPYTNNYERDVWNYENMRNMYVNDVIRIKQGTPEEWKYRYYSYYSKTHGNQRKFMDMICNKYMEGLLWVLSYYQGVCGWRWAYQFGCPPFASDLYEYLTNEKILYYNNLQLNIETPVSVDTQLSAIMPPASRYLLTKVVDFTTVKDMFPVEFELDMMYKTMYWQCEPILPPLDIKRIEELVK